MNAEKTSWLARQNPDEDLAHHLETVAGRASRYAAELGYPNLAYEQGLHHDAGKALRFFQEYLKGRCDRDGYNHSTAGALLLGEEHSSVQVALPVACHHGGLQSISHVASRLHSEQSSDPRVQVAIQNAKPLLETLPRREPEPLPADSLDASFALRMVHSALIDADWTSVAHHTGSYVAPAAPSISALTDVMIQSQDAITDDSTEINRIRGDIRQQCVDASVRPPGLYAASIPTGGGKTRALLEFALRHARHHGLSRVIVLAPYVTILRQSAKVYRAKIFDQYGEEAVLEHHSKVELSRASTHEYAQATSRWDRPIVVTSFVQALESLMHTSNSRLRKIHRFSDSVVIVDEIQNVPYDLRATTIWMLEQLVDLGASVIASSATQIPMPSQEIIDDPPALYARMKRVEYEYDLTPHAPNEIWALAESSSLVVTNSKRDARRLAESNPGALHLSTAMTPAHRTAVIKDVRMKLARRESVQLVSTQLVEAGVDLDFRQAIRIFGPLDRTIQAAGRCNREGRGELGQVLVARLKGGTCPPGAYEAGIDVHQEMYDRHGAMDLNDPKWLAEYYRLMESRVGSKHPEITACLAEFDYPAAATLYQLIDTEDEADVLIVDDQHGAPGELARELASGHITWRLLRHTQQYVVSLYDSELKHAKASGQVEMLRDDLDLYVWRGRYSSRLGIDTT